MMRATYCLVIGNILSICLTLFFLKSSGFTISVRGTTHYLPGGPLLGSVVTVITAILSFVFIAGILFRETTR